jgi:hypothetical protein
MGMYLLRDLCDTRDELHVSLLWSLLLATCATLAHTHSMDSKRAIFTRTALDTAKSTVHALTRIHVFCLFVCLRALINNKNIRWVVRFTYDLCPATATASAIDSVVDVKNRSVIIAIKIADDPDRLHGRVTFGRLWHRS